MEKDIERAIIAEQEYIQDSDPDHFPLIERVKEFGFETLDEYFYTKVKYQINKENLTIKDCHMEDGVDEVFQYIKEGKAGAFTVKEKEPRTWIWAGKDNMYVNVEKANELGYSIRNFDYAGGPIVTTNDDFSLALVLPNNIDLDISVLLKYIIDFISSKGYTVTNDSNDLLIDGKKVLGNIYRKYELATLFAFQISLVSHEEIINQISLKESIKVPGYISNINRDEFEEELNKWLHTI